MCPGPDLQSATRAYAKIIDEVNKLPLSALQRPVPADPNAPGSAAGYLSLEHCEEWVKDSTKNCAK